MPSSFLSLFSESRLLPSRAFRAHHSSNSFLPILFFTLLSYNCSQVSRQQNISKPRSFHYKANATFEIARNYARDQGHLRRNEPSGSLANFNYILLCKLLMILDGIKLMDSISNRGGKRRRRREREKEEHQRNRCDTCETCAIERMAVSPRIE